MLIKKWRQGKGERIGRGGTRTALACLILLVALTLTSGSAGTESGRKAHDTCTVCHEDAKEFKAIKAKIDETCLRCHPQSAREHPMGVVPAVIPEGLPLGKGNTITCITCHDPHGDKTVAKLLRMEFNKLCLACHKNIGTN